VSASALLVGLGAGALCQHLWSLPFAAGGAHYVGEAETARPNEGSAKLTETPEGGRLFWGAPVQQRRFFVSDAVAGHVHRPGARRVYPWPEHPQQQIEMVCNNLGFLKKYVQLEPAVFCITVYAGNDFLDAIATGQLRRQVFVPLRPPEYVRQLKAASAISKAAVDQALNQVTFVRGCQSQSPVRIATIGGRPLDQCQARGRDDA